MKNKFSVLMTAMFCLFISGMLIVSTVLPDKEFSELENRYLAKPPRLTAETVMDGTFMDQAEKYTEDHIVFRDFWVAMKAWCERLSGKKENSGAYFGSQGTLIRKMADPDPEKLEKDLGYIDTLTGNVSVPVYLGLIPTSACIWADRLPKGAPTADEKSIIDDMYFTTGAKTIDFYGALSAHADEDIFYRTDHHWTSLGAFYGANAIYQAMGLEPVSLDSYEKKTVSTDFYGTVFSSSGVRWVEPDCIDTYVTEDGVHVTSYFEDTPSEGKLYVDKFLSVKDKYSYFLGGRQPLCIIRSDKTDGPKVLVVRDSYSDSLAPFLTERFSETHLWDPRNNLRSIKEYVAENGIDAVCVIYSYANFIDDANLFLLAG